MNNIMDYLENAAITFPEKTAVSMGSRALSFSELLLLSKRLAALPKETNAPIGVLASRDVNTIAYFFGAVYSGSCYVPLDPDMPPDKLQLIIDDAGISTIFGNEENRAVLEKVDYSGQYFSAEDISESEKTELVSDADSPLYLIYTSGSTGVPKGVLKSHKSVISFIEAYCGTFDFSSGDIIGSQTPFFFDASAKDIYLMLKTGAALEIIPTEKFAMPTDLIDYLNEKKITMISWVPTALSIVAQLRTFEYVLPKYLKKVFFVGEVMPVKYLNQWRRYLPDLLYVNLYGQTEIAGICCYYIVSGSFDPADTLPMGRALKNCEIYLVDGDTVITEPNHTGEMYLVSDALALGYCHDEKKNASSFLEKDFGHGAVRCFRTGDLAQYDENGNLIFKARTDFQIKHMGHRIELGEIEAKAGAIPEIARCCCLYQSEKRKIVLFCELNQGAEITGREIQSLLRSRLSSYMVPGKITIMDRLPINANGKINRVALKEKL